MLAQNRLPMDGSQCPSLSARLYAYCHGMATQGRLSRTCVVCRIGVTPSAGLTDHFHGAEMVFTVLRIVHPSAVNCKQLGMFAVNMTQCNNPPGKCICMYGSLNNVLP